MSWLAPSKYMRGFPGSLTGVVFRPLIGRAAWYAMRGGAAVALTDIFEQSRVRIAVFPGFT